MTTTQIIVASVVWAILLGVAYSHSGWTAIKDCYKMWFTKAVIIIPGLIFGIQIWWLYFLTLGTSLTLIWASNKKLLPTLVGFNTIWAWISCMVLAQHLIK